MPTYNLNEFMVGHHEYIDSSSARLSQLFNITWLSRNLHPHKVMFDNESDFKRYFTPFLKDFDIKNVLTTIKTPQTNTPVEWVHWVILHTLATKYLDNKVFEYINPWGENLAYIAWTTRAYYNRTIQATPGQYDFRRDMIFNLESVIYWRVITAGKQ